MQVPAGKPWSLIEWLTGSFTQEPWAKMCAALQIINCSTLVFLPSLQAKEKQQPNCMSEKS